MDRCYNFAVIRLAPQGPRGESLNVGLAVFGDQMADVRPAKRLEKVRALSAGIDPNVVKDLILSLRSLDAKLADRGMSAIERHSMLSTIGPVELSELGEFYAHDADTYELRIDAIFKAVIEPEVGRPKLRKKTSKIISQMKIVFKQERVLAQKDESIDSHRIVVGFPIDDGLIADMALKNGAMHIVQTIDASGDDQSIRRTIGDIGVSALVLESARMKFGDKNTRSLLVYEASSQIEKLAHAALEVAVNQGARLVNWASAEDRLSFVHGLTSLATPIEQKRNMIIPNEFRRASLF